jgi:hypothetical protein
MAQDRSTDIILMIKGMRTSRLSIRSLSLCWRERNEAAIRYVVGDKGVRTYRDTSLIRNSPPPQDHHRAPRHSPTVGS